MRLTFVAMVCFAVAIVGTTGCPKPAPKSSPKDTTKVDVDTKGTKDHTKTHKDTKDTKTPKDTKDTKTPPKDTKETKPVPPPSAGNFKIEEPKKDAEIKITKGKKADVEVKIKRDDFKDDVTLWPEIKGDAKGVTVKDAKDGIDLKGKSEGKITLEAAADAKGSGELIIAVVGGDEKKTKHTVKVKLTVE